MGFTAATNPRVSRAGSKQTSRNTRSPIDRFPTEVFAARVLSLQRKFQDDAKIVCESRSLVSAHDFSLEPDLVNDYRERHDSIWPGDPPKLTLNLTA